MRKKCIKILFYLIGPIALLWLIIRSGTKPSRLSYPCQRASLPFAVGFLMQVGSTLSIPISKLWIKRRNVFLYLMIGICIIFFLPYFIPNMSSLDVPRIFSFMGSKHWTPTDPNQPIGTPKGIFPGRVVWVHDTSATSWDGLDNYWWDTTNTDQERVNWMLDTAILALTGKTSISSAWDTLFKFFNQGTGYTPGENIAIKVNLNPASGSWYGMEDNDCYPSPQLVVALLRQLVHHAEVPESCIIIYDCTRIILNLLYNPIHDSFPEVKFVDRIGGAPNRRERVPSNIVAVSYGSQNWHIGDTAIVSAKYLIDMAILKFHGTSGVTIVGKNHFGSIYPGPGELHYPINQDYISMGSWSPFVELLANQHLGGKTILFICDGLYGGPNWSGVPRRWARFNNDWPSSIFISQDPVAINSVLWDFLNAEDSISIWPIDLRETSQNFLHELALPDEKYGNPPPPSLGVHEHWDNWENKHYVGPDSNGIDFIKIEPSYIEVEEKIDQTIEEVKVVAMNKIKLTLKESDWVSFKVYDISGRCIIEVPERYMEKGVHLIELPYAKEIPHGNYILWLTLKNKSMIYKRKLSFIK